MLRKRLGEMFRQERERLEEYRFLWKPTVILAAIYLLAMTAVLRADFYYYDDIARALEGYSRWGFSRHLSNFLSQFLHGDSYLTDISPLPQLLAIVITAMASALAVYCITGEKKFGSWHYWAAIPLGLSPYYLECLSYKYDSPYMALSLLFSVLPLMFRERKRMVYILWTMVCMIGMCTSYQASAGIFPMLVIVVGIRRWVDGEKTVEVLRYFAISAVGYLVGLILFRKVIMTEFVAYASTTAASLSNLIPCAITNYKRYIVHFLEGFKPEWLVVSFLLCVCFLWTAVAQSKQNKLLTFFLVGAAMIVMFMLSFGVYPFLTEPLFYPRAMYGIGCFLGFQGIYAATKRPKGYVSKAMCLVLGWYFFVFSFTYGNALSVQSQYTDYRITQVIDDLIECDTLDSEEEVTLQITGTIGYAPALEHMLEDFPMIKKLVPVTFIGDGWWGEYGIRYYYGLPDMKFAETYDPPELEMEVIADNYLHTICANENYIWIDLH